MTDVGVETGLAEWPASFRGRLVGPTTSDRLARVKAVYDPDKVFHRNAKIAPTIDRTPR